MAYFFNRIVLLGLTGGALALTGCDKGSLGQYGETEGESNSGTDSASGSGSASASTSGSGTASAGSTSAGSASTSVGSTSGNPTSTTTASSATDTDTDTAGGACEGNPDFMCSAPVDCGVMDCGGLESFDDSGCLRPRCQAHDECGADELCYRGEDFGGCSSSEVFCGEDEMGQCVCGSTDDCSGGICVPADVYPIEHGVVEMGPGAEARYENGCAPNDAAAMDFLLGLSDATCAVPAGNEGVLRFQLLPPISYGTYHYLDTLTTGWFDENANGQFDAGEGAEDGIVRITNVNGGVVSGQYELKFGDTLLMGAFEDISLCMQDVLCG